jgi:hypothetical protein
MTFLECAANLPGVRPPVGTIVLSRISSSARRRYRCRRVAILRSKVASSELLDLISLQGDGDAGHAIHRETFLKLMPRFPVARKLALDVLIGAPSQLILPDAPFSASIEPHYGLSEEVFQYVSGYHEAAGAYDLWCADGPMQYAFGAADDDFAEASPGSTAYAQKSADLVFPDAPAAAETLEADRASARDDAGMLNPNAVTCDARDGGADCSDMGEHVDAAVAADLKDEVCTAAGANIERHEDPEAVKPPTEAVPFPGGACVASSPSVDAIAISNAVCRSDAAGRLCDMRGWGPDSVVDDPLELALEVWALVAKIPKSATEALDNIGDLGLICMFCDLVFAVVQDARAQRSTLGKCTVGELLDFIAIELVEIWGERPDLGKRQYLEPEWVLSELKEEILCKRLIR